MPGSVLLSLCQVGWCMISGLWLPNSGRLACSKTHEAIKVDQGEGTPGPQVPWSDLDVAPFFCLVSLPEFRFGL